MPDVAAPDNLDRRWRERLARVAALDPDSSRDLEPTLRMRSTR
jgi:hypothetical protein